MTKALQCGILCAGLLSLAIPAAASDWPMFGHDPARSSVDVGDTILTVANVAHLRTLWQVSYGTVADSTPIFIQKVIVGGIARSMLFQTTKSGVTVATDANTGHTVWRFRTTGPNITTSTPVEDPSGQAIYVPGVDGYVHKLNAATGQHVPARGFPARITRIPNTEKDASSLNLANGYLYATTSGYDGDYPFYDGHVVSVRLSDGLEHVFNSLCSKVRTLPIPSDCSDSDSGIWGRGGAVVDPDPSMHGAVFAATGNGDFDANTGGDNYGDSILGLSADVSTLLGNYTPTDFVSLYQGDVDLGSTSPVILPRQNASRTPLMIVQGGKDSILRLVNRATLPGVGHELQEISGPAPLFSSPAVWTDPSGRVWVFVEYQSEIDAYVLATNNGSSRLVKMWSAGPGYASGEGASPVVSNGLVFATFDAIYALDARNGHILWNSSKTGGKSIGSVHWESPIVVNGHVYCSDENGNLTAFALR